MNRLDKVFPVIVSGVSVRGGELGAVWRPSLALSSAAVTRRRQNRFITLSPSVSSYTFDIWQLPGRPWRLEGKLKATLKLQERVLRVTVTVWMNRARHAAQWVGLYFRRILILSGPLYCSLRSAILYHRLFRNSLSLFFFLWFQEHVDCSLCRSHYRMLNMINQRKVTVTVLLL